MKFIQFGFRKVRCGVWLARKLLGLKPSSDAEAWFHLSLGLARGPRFVPGQFRFSFGTVRYVDGRSFAYQFEDIFVRRVYDFATNQPHPLILDRGGNVGLSAIWFKRRHPECRLTVFEADPAIANVLEENLKAHHLEGVKVVRSAVWSANGTVHFAGDGADGGRIASDVADEVPAVRLSDWITEPVELLKMDIEGAEFEVLNDLCATGKIRQVRRLACEVHNRDGNGAQFRQLLEALAQNGFRICLSHARSAPDLPGAAQPTPFPAVADGKWLLELYAWTG